MDSLEYVHVSLAPGSPELDTVLSGWPHQSWVEGKDYFPPSAGDTLAITAKDTISLLCRRSHASTFMFKEVSTRTHSLFLPSCSPVGWSPPMGPTEQKVSVTNLNGLLEIRASMWKTQKIKLPKVHDLERSWEILYCVLVVLFLFATEQVWSRKCRNN